MTGGGGVAAEEGGEQTGGGEYDGGFERERDGVHVSVLLFWRFG